MCSLKIYFLFLFFLNYSSDLNLQFKTYDNKDIFFNKSDEIIQASKLFKQLILYGSYKNDAPKLNLDFLTFDNIKLFENCFYKIKRKEELDLKNNFFKFVQVLLCANFFNNKVVLKNLSSEINLPDYCYLVENKLIQKDLLDDICNKYLEDLKINFDIQNFLLLPNFLVFKDKFKELKVFDIKNEKVIFSYKDVECFTGGLTGRYIAFVDGDLSLFVLDLSNLRRYFVSPGVSKSCFRFDCNDKNIIFERSQNLSVYSLPRLTPIFEELNFLDSNSKVDRHIFLKQCGLKDRIILVDLVQKKKVMEFDEAYNAAISSDNKYGFIKFNGGLVQFFSTSDYKIIKEYEYVSEVKFLPDSNKIGLVSNNKFELLNLETNQKELSFSASYFDFNFKGSFVTLYYGSYLRILNLKTKKIVYENNYWDDKKDNIFYDFLGEFVSILRSNKLFLLDLTTEKVIYQEDDVDTVKFDTQGKNLAIFYEGSVLKIINLNQLKFSRQISAALWNDNLILLNEKLKKKGLKIFS